MGRIRSQREAEKRAETKNTETQKKGWVIIAGYSAFLKVIISYSVNHCDCKIAISYLTEHFVLQTIPAIYRIFKCSCCGNIHKDVML